MGLVLLRIVVLLILERNISSEIIPICSKHSDMIFVRIMQPNSWRSALPAPTRDVDRNYLNR
jgi:hypothetical protein